MIIVSTSIPKILGKLYGFPKNLESLERHWEKNFEIFRSPSILTDILPKYSGSGTYKIFIIVYKQVIFINIFSTRYKQEFVQEAEDISHPIFVATALYTACKYE